MGNYFEMTGKYVIFAFNIRASVIFGRKNLD